VAVRVSDGMFVVGWGSRTQSKRAGVHFVDSVGSWVRVSDAPRMMTKRNAVRCARAAKSVGVVGVCLVAGCAV